MFIKHRLLVLPIHHSTSDKYRTKHEESVARKKHDFEKLSGRSFENLNPNLQTSLETTWFCPPWYFNDIIGFLDIGSDGYKFLVGEIYLKRKYFPLTSRLRGNYTTLINHEIHYYYDVLQLNVDITDNETYLQATLTIVRKTRSIVRKRFRSAEVWLPAYDLNCLNLAEADRQMRHSL